MHKSKFGKCLPEQQLELCPKPKLNSSSQHDAKLPVMCRWMLGGLSEAEWGELVALEYVLTWNYTDDIEKDEKRYRLLSDRCWAGRANGA